MFKEQDSHTVCLLIFLDTSLRLLVFELKQNGCRPTVLTKSAHNLALFPEEKKKRGKTSIHYAVC